jgi:hypothetical protein
MTALVTCAPYALFLVNHGDMWIAITQQGLQPPAVPLQGHCGCGAAAALVATRAHTQVHCHSAQHAQHSIV